MDKDTEVEDPNERDEALAGEFVLGVLSKDEHAACARRVEEDADFRAIVDRWSRDLAPVSDEINPITPPARVRGQVNEALFAEREPSKRSGFLARIWSSAGLWRSVAVLAIIAAGGIGYELDRRTKQMSASLETALAELASARNAADGMQAELADARSTIPALEQQVEIARADARVADETMQALLNRPATVLTGRLSSADSPVLYEALYWADTDTLTLAREGQGAPAGRDFELWLVEDGQSPRSLGVLPQESRGAVALPEQFGSRLAPNSAFAISLEPLGGAPDGVPTGPIVASGKIIDTP